MILLNTFLSHPKPLDLVPHVVPDVRSTLLERGLRFVQWRRTRNSFNIQQCQILQQDLICCAEKKQAHPSH